MSEKTIYIESAWKSPLSVQDLILYPPEGYKFATSRSVGKNLFRLLAKYDFSYKLQAFMGNIIPLQLFKSKVDRLNSPPKGSILTYSLCHLVIRREPWILDMLTELPYILAWNEEHLSRYREQIRRILASEYCKKIICRVEKGRGAFLATFGAEFAEKTETVYGSASPKNFRKNYYKDRIKILFVNSGNINTALHFYNKGGAEVVQAFLRLQRKYRDKIELILRSGMPKQLKEKYSSLPNVKVIDEPIPWDELEKEWKTADIFVMPNHVNTPAQIFLDAMSYGLPIVTTDTWANSEFVQDGKTGFLVHNPRSARFQDGPILHLTHPEYVKEIIRGPEFRVVEELTKAISTLIENPELRKKMGEATLWEVQNGKFSLKKRNEKLKKILDEATIQN